MICDIYYKLFEGSYCEFSKFYLLQFHLQTSKLKEHNEAGYL